MRAITHTERAKSLKYSSLALQYGATFIPFVCDVFGALGGGAHRLIDWLVTEASSSGRLNNTAERSEFRSMAYARISVAVQRATAICAVAGSMRIRGAAMPPPS